MSTATHPGQKVVDTTGSKVGKVSDIISDPRTLEPKWVSVSFGLAKHRALVPLHDSFVAEDGVLVVPFSVDTIKHAPVSHGVAPSQSEEEELVRHYGLPEQN